MLCHALTFCPLSPPTQHRPHTFDKFELHKDIADNLKKLVGAASAQRQL